MNYIIAIIFLFFFTGCQKNDIQIPNLTSWSNLKESNSNQEIKEITNPYQRINTFSTQEKITILTNHYMKEAYNIPKPVLPEKPSIPTISPAKELVKGEFESTKKFRQRIKNENEKKSKEIYKMKKLYIKNVSFYNEEVKSQTNTYNKKIEELKFNEQKLLSQATAKALFVIYGKPKIKELEYDADNEIFFGRIVSSKANFDERVAIKVPIEHAQTFKKNLDNIKLKIVFDLQNNKLRLKRLDIPFEDKTYTAILTDVNYKSKIIKVALNQDNIQLEKVDLLSADSILNQNDYNLKELDFSVDSEIIQMRKIKFELELQARKKRFQKQKALEFTRIKKELEKDIATYTKKAGGYDDIPDLLKQVKQVKIDNKKWLVIIAIEDYEVTTTVNFAKNSALKFKEVAKKTLGISEKNIRTLVNATSGNIKRNLKSMLRQVEAGDTVYFYYSGHGIPVASQNNEPYILPKDMSPDYIQDENYFKLRNIYSSLTNSKASKVIAFTDSCFSGVTDNKSVLREGLGATRLKPRNIKFDFRKMVVLSAGTGKEYSNMYEKRSHRLFSYFVMKSLLKGNKTIKSLHEDIYANVKKESYKLGSLYEQHPTIEGNKSLEL